MATFATNALAQSAVVAMVADLQGRATIRLNGKAQPLGITEHIPDRAQVLVESGATLVALYLEGGEGYELKGPAQVIFKAGQPEVVTGAPAVRRGVALGKGVREVALKQQGMARAAMVMRGSRPGQRIRLLNLVDTLTLEQTPEFRWQSAEQGARYQFELSDDSGRILFEIQVEGVALKLPDSTQLRQGSSYRWTVSTRLRDGRRYSSAAEFRVAAADVRASAESMRPPQGAPVAERVAYAAWLGQHALIDEARKYLKEVAVERPEDLKLKALTAE